MGSILVTGGAGFIGSHVVDRLLAEGERIVVLDNFDPFYDPAVKRANLRGHGGNENFLLVEGDIRDAALVEKLFVDHAVDRVIHLAAKAGVRPSLKDPIQYEDVNVRGTLVLLEQARKQNVGNFVFGSSSSIYGDSPDLPYSEDHPVARPVSPYAATKRSCELFCATTGHLYRMPITCLRYFTVYGPRQRPEMAIHHFVRLIDSNRPIPMFGDGSSRRDYTFVDDAVSATVAALRRPRPFEIINIGEARTVSLKELIALIAETLGKKADVTMLSEQPGDVRATYARIDKARRLLDYTPATPIEEGIRLFIEWYRNAGDKKP